MLPCSVLTSPPWYGPPRPWPRAHRPTIRLCKAACLPYLPLFPHLVKFLANTMQINTSCKDCDSINQHSHQSTRTTGPQGGGGQTVTMPRGGGGGATLEHIYGRSHDMSCFFGSVCKIVTCSGLRIRYRNQVLS